MITSIDVMKQANMVKVPKVQVFILLKTAQKMSMVYAVKDIERSKISEKAHYYEFVVKIK